MQRAGCGTIAPSPGDPAHSGIVNSEWRRRSDRRILWDARLIGAPLIGESCPRLQLMILLSALLASLTGLVAGERPAEQTRIERSAVAAIVQTGEAIAIAQARPVQALPGLVAVLLLAGLACAVAPVRSLRTSLRFKQSWLN